MQLGQARSSTILEGQPEFGLYSAGHGKQVGILERDWQGAEQLTRKICFVAECRINMCEGRPKRKL